MTNKIYDVAIVGAGLAGLTCAKRLQELGFGVIILEKSRGLGGRVATRRLQDTWVDHGNPYLEVQGSFTEQLMRDLCNQGICHLWTGSITQLSQNGELQPYSSQSAYVSGTGLSAIAKFLATDLEIWRSCRVINLALNSKQTWKLSLETDSNYPHVVEAKTVVLAIPAPQALMLIEASAIKNLAPSFLSDLASVRFNPCLAVMAGYDSRYLSELSSQWQSLRIFTHPNLSWISVESSKKNNSEAPIFIFHSTPSFAQTYLDTSNLELAGQQLLDSASQLFFSWLNQPLWFQVHRWRYALPLQSLSVSCLVATDPLPIVCCGDWCGGHLVESALNSGFTAADKVLKNLLF
ncbi:FAD-dependent oxidoreductase [Aphanothece hegewaldii CCALA 016]|uniref:FAD-dependent oxidoreductase n=1 Tax=Aphanothece hegewaldii CCALA 016 TaxID=2107694 RepID=A0A2T1M3E3_9CHRO|nr:FAD-dependent oxidoreductase [Aphanothece hegewaldii]PSF39338.1 FAD-dependent oxidoreductase [Aphanothece hegewaldii CCALA 016]